MQVPMQLILNRIFTVLVPFALVMDLYKHLPHLDREQPLLTRKLVVIAQQKAMKRFSQLNAAHCGFFFAILGDCSCCWLSTS